MSTTHSILVITTTLGYRHSSIPSALHALQSPPHPALPFTNTESDLSTYFDSPSTLAPFSALLFLSSIGDIFTPAQLANLSTFAANPRNAIIGIHSATATHSRTDSFARIFGASFDYHPDFQTGDVFKLTASTTPALETSAADVSDGDGHVSVRNLPARVTVADEQYNFFSDVRKSGVTVVAEWDRASYRDDGERKAAMGELQPAVWCREGGGGEGDGSVRCRVWYTSLGHSEEIWSEAWFVGHVFGGIEWALRV